MNITNGGVRRYRNSSMRAAVLCLTSLAVAVFTDHGAVQRLALLSACGFFLYGVYRGTLWRVLVSSPCPDETVTGVVDDPERVPDSCSPRKGG